MLDSSLLGHNNTMQLWKSTDILEEHITSIIMVKEQAQLGAYFIMLSCLAFIALSSTISQMIKLFKQKYI
jgi:hypothetical protein